MCLDPQYPKSHNNLVLAVGACFKHGLCSTTIEMFTLLVLCHFQNIECKIETLRPLKEN